MLISQSKCANFTYILNSKTASPEVNGHLPFVVKFIISKKSSNCSHHIKSIKNRFCFTFQILNSKPHLSAIVANEPFPNF